jgi:DNA-binding transcriptional LysR family regulator
MLSTLKDADDAMARFRKLESGLLSVGMVGTAKYFVPHLLTRFREEHPGVELRLQVGANREELVTCCNWARWTWPSWAARPRKWPCAPSPLRRTRMCLWRRRPPHPAPGPPAGAAVAGYPLIVREPASGTRALMDRFFQDQRVEPRIAMEMPSNETIKQAVMAGMGLSFLSLHTLGLELQSAG